MRFRDQAQPNTVVAPYNDLMAEAANPAEDPNVAGERAGGADCGPYQ